MTGPVFSHWRLTPALQLSTRAAAAAGLSLATAEGLHLQFPIYAMIGSVIVTELSPVETRRLGRSRLVATIVGATVGALLSQTSVTRAILIAIGIGSSMFIMHAAGYSGAARVAGYTCGLVMLQYHEHPWVYAWYRLYETVLGILMATLVSYVPMLIRKDSGQAA